MARKKLCVPKNWSINALPCRLYMATYHGAAIKKNSSPPLKTFMFLISRQPRVKTKNSTIIRPGSKKPIGPLVKVASAMPIYMP